MFTHLGRVNSFSLSEREKKIKTRGAGPTPEVKGWNCTFISFLYHKPAQTVASEPHDTHNIKPLHPRRISIYYTLVY